jgi:hypothetical protein
VNAVGLDDYVRGVVAAEMPAGWLAAPGAGAYRVVAGGVDGPSVSVG